MEEERTFSAQHFQHWRCARLLVIGGGGGGGGGNLGNCYVANSFNLLLLLLCRPTFGIHNSSLSVQSQNTQLSASEQDYDAKKKKRKQRN
jgi:hypothetical protein